MGTSNVLERLDSSTYVNDNLAELRGQIVRQVSQIEVPLRQEHQNERCSRRLGQGNEAPPLVLPDGKAIARGARTTRGRILVVTGCFGNFGTPQRRDAKALQLEGKGFPVRQSRERAPFLVFIERRRILKVLIRRERHARIVTQTSSLLLVVTGRVVACGWYHC